MGRSENSALDNSKFYHVNRITAISFQLDRVLKTMKCAFKLKALSGAKVGQQAANAPWESELWDWDQCSKRMVTKEI